MAGMTSYAEVWRPFPSETYKATGRKPVELSETMEMEYHEVVERKPRQEQHSGRPKLIFSVVNASHREKV